MPAVIPFVTFALATITGADPVSSRDQAYPLHEGGEYVRVMSEPASRGVTLSVSEGGLIADTPSRAASAPDAPHGTLLEGSRS